MITERQRHLVRTSWAAVVPLGPAAAVLFYDRLFTLDPALRALFSATDMPSQHAKLLQMLSVAVASLDRLDTLAPAIEGLGRRHGGYGVTHAHYATVGAALLWTLEQGLGEDFTAETRGAWATVYELLAGIMRSASAAGLPPAQPVVGTTA